MTPNEYQKKTGETQTSECQDIYYLTLGLCSEAGEVAGKLKKWTRGDYKEMDIDEAFNLFSTQILNELGDVLWYVARIADFYNTSLEDVMEGNLIKLKQRQFNNTIKGDGDNR